MTLSRLAAAVTLQLLFPGGASAQEPQPILVWPNGAPGSEGRTGPESVRLTEQGEHIISQVHRPSITPYLPAAATATGAAVIVIPGGGHRELWMDHEGYRVGRWLSDHGIAAFVLKYRLARDTGSRYTVEGHALADVQQAILLVRRRVNEWHLDAGRIGVMGFSAGGELAVLAGTRFDGDSTRPAFMGLIYPSVPNAVMFSPATPPTFLLCGENDSAIAASLPAVQRAIRRQGVSSELHILGGAGHGFGIRDNNPRAVAAWPSMFYNWLEARHFLAERPGGAPLSPQMQDGISGSRPVPAYTPAERQGAAQRVLRLAAPPVLGDAVALTPNAPYGQGGAHLSVWKPSFVLGMPGGGEIGVNFWGIHNEGHVNVGLTSSGTASLLDCRLLSHGDITWKIYIGAGERLRDQGRTALADNHFLLMVPAGSPGDIVSVELWPTPVTEPLGFLGCDLVPVTPSP